ncbi:DUF1439 domain-containing protein [Ramlibacter tataouinensis]|uniref:DUF1439 domain-containing protein n=1 Tax=Ramlibacter tataouinensis TaxID=94132 RepID=UPI0022F3F65B|nr:DUF1439 domain-containing protein [Ramlibacter tataouinensis]WBY01172.1 DUF1439 domain-containing protein [Ramlibacter tataouinensis]
MQRRLLICALACCPVAALATEQEPGGQPRHKISATTLHQALSERFPVRLGLGGLLELQVSAPRLHLVPVRNQLGAALQAQAGGPVLQPLPPGELDLVFGVRYEPADRTLRAHRPEILELRLPGLAPAAAEALHELLPAMARQVLGDIVLHRFSPRELALADTLGFEPDQVTVVDDGLVLAFAPKPRR